MQYLQIMTPRAPTMYGMPKKIYKEDIYSTEKTNG